VKKFLRGDGYWETRKVILGWIIDTVAMTLELPAHGRKRLQAILENIPALTLRRTSVRKWHRLLGELRGQRRWPYQDREAFSVSSNSHCRERIEAASDWIKVGVHDALGSFR
jgi:hypothetical protein